MKRNKGNMWGGKIGVGWGEEREFFEENLRFERTHSHTHTLTNTHGKQHS